MVTSRTRFRSGQKPEFINVYAIRAEAGSTLNRAVPNRIKPTVDVVTIYMRGSVASTMVRSTVVPTTVMAAVMAAAMVTSSLTATVAFRVRRPHYSKSERRSDRRMRQSFFDIFVFLRAIEPVVVLSQKVRERPLNESVRKRVCANLDRGISIT